MDISKIPLLDGVLYVVLIACNAHLKINAYNVIYPISGMAQVKTVILAVLTVHLVTQMEAANIV